MASMASQVDHYARAIIIPEAPQMPKEPILRSQVPSVQEWEGLHVLLVMTVPLWLPKSNRPAPEDLEPLLTSGEAHLHVARGWEHACCPSTMLCPCQLSAPLTDPPRSIRVTHGMHMRIAVRCSSTKGSHGKCSSRHDQAAT